MTHVLRFNKEIWAIVKDVWNQFLASEDDATILTPGKSNIEEFLKHNTEIRNAAGHAALSKLLPLSCPGDIMPMSMVAKAARCYFWNAEGGVPAASAI